MTDRVALAPTSGPEARERRLGLLLGFLGVLVFSLSLPVTRRAVIELDAGFVAFGRMALAGLAAVVLLALRRAPLPARRDLPALLTVAGGVVLGFPLFSTLAMREVDASHGGVVLAILPLATAAAGAVLGGERPSGRFWAASGAGALLVLGFALWRSRGAPGAGDLYLLLACALCAAGYAAGGRLARRIPGLQVIAWALVLTLPVSLAVAALRWPAVDPAASTTAWLAFLYVALMSQFFGFYFWYGGLARGGIARVGQVQLLQTFLTLIASWALLGERVDPVAWLFAAGAVAAVWAARRAPVRGRG
jgi:drug/metabolite transporter (DMT)-like permease